MSSQCLHVDGKLGCLAFWGTDYTRNLKISFVWLRFVRHLWLRYRGKRTSLWGGICQRSISLKLGGERSILSQSQSGLRLGPHSQRCAPDEFVPHNRWPQRQTSNAGTHQICASLLMGWLHTFYFHLFSILYILIIFSRSWMNVGHC